MKTWIVLFTCLVFFAPHVNAMPLTKSQQEKLKKNDNSNLRDQMAKMIISIADFDIIINKDNTVDYDIFREDAQRILTAIDNIEKMDKHGIFKKNLRDLRQPTEKVLKLSLAKNPKAAKYAQEIFDACFKCHQDHRQY